MFGELFSHSSLFWLSFVFIIVLKYLELQYLARISSLLIANQVGKITLKILRSKLKTANLKIKNFSYLLSGGIFRYEPIKTNFDRT